MISPQRTTPHFFCRRCVLLRLLMQERVFLLDPAPLRLIFLLRLLGTFLCGVPFAVVEEKYAGERPVRGTGPVGEEDEEADGEDVVAADAVVGVGEVDAGDAVVEAEGEEGGLAEEEGCEGALGWGGGEVCWVGLVGVEWDEGGELDGIGRWFRGF